MSDPLVSIIIPAYNRAPLLPATLESILAEDYPAKEIIVVDDGSTDNTGEVCARHPVRYFARENRGVSAARNFGVTQCSGGLLVFLDSDDLCPPGSLRQRVDYWRREPNYGHVTGRLQRFREDTPGKIEFIESEDAFHCISSGAEVISRDAFEKTGGFTESIRVGEDMDFWMRMWDRGFRQKLIPETCLHVRVHAGNTTRDRARLQQAFLSMIHKTIKRRREQTAAQAQQ